MSTFKRKPANKRSLSLRKLVHGFGINDADYITQQKINGKQVVCPVYRKWVSMLNRAYDPNLHERRPTYIGVTVCDEWLAFSNFAKWFDSKYIDGYVLDKDIKVKGNKIYSPEMCLFVPTCINTLLVDCSASRGALPLGVSFHKKAGKLQSNIRIDGELKKIGYFDDEKEAHSAYVKEKNKEIKRKCGQYPQFAKYLIIHLIKI